MRLLRGREVLWLVPCMDCIYCRVNGAETEYTCEVDYPMRKTKPDGFCDRGEMEHKGRIIKTGDTV